MKTTLSKFLPILLWVIVIFAFSANPDPYAALPKQWAGPEESATLAPSGKLTKPPPSTDEIIGRILHIGEYMVLGLLVLRAVAWNAAIRSGNALLAAGLSLLYALSDETHQLFVPGRAFEIEDLLLDLTGILFGLAIYYFVMKNKGLNGIENQG